MAYSVLQTLIHYNYKKLSSHQIVIIYGTMNKYIKYALNEKIEKINIDKFNSNKNKLEEVNKENNLKQYFNLLLKIKKLTKLMKVYSLLFNEIIKYKQRYESSIQIELDERDGEIERINSGLLTNSFISELLKFLKDEIIKNNEIKKFLYDLKEYSKLLSYEFIYKCFLFIDFFWNAIIPHELVDVLYGFSNNRNIYSYVINQNIYGLLEELYQYNYKKEYRKYYILLKYTKGIKLSYISETLIRKLNLSKEDLNNNDINSLLIKDLFIPHYYAVNQHFIINQKNVLIDKNVHIFNHKKYMINCVLNSTFQIGMNKNILIICTIQLNERNNKISFFAQKNLKIISINQNFENKFHLSLALIEELKIEIKDLFGIVKNNIIKKYKKEIKAFKEVKHFIKLDPKQYLLKNIFNSENIKYNFRLLDENIFNKYNKENEKDNKLDDDDEKKLLKSKIKNFFIKIIDKIYDNETPDLPTIKSINFKIDNEIIINKMKILIEKISVYEQGKLENKNIYNDFLNLNQNYDNFFKYNIFSILNIKPILIYDSMFYLCEIELYENNIIAQEIIPTSEKKRIK